ncbi:hypothetical protein T11_8834 [Trichinella zimbabwensis]|uniref:Uncharacterized protein n=1 Tax=Trichinella zimbabwensis TaxID=268475 RepID=A0A0V1HSR2_9BILA|nr:hypothetical protein T11_8834 [Trichinella zimbabwensis]
MTKAAQSRKLYQADPEKAKCRVVFDSSSEMKGTSLHRCLDPGPKLQPDLISVLNLDTSKHRKDVSANRSSPRRLRAVSVYVARSIFQSSRKGLQIDAGGV